ncbi:MAG TPA: hypothetical protein VKT82_17800 [Ktedonobacterales bacterium]|nr:hypothetical protein [Ktedonobacterales bacterium]
MGKYKQWLHHQEVGARLRDEIAAHEAERERVLKLAPTKETSLPDVSNPIIAALLGQVSLTKAAEPVAAKNGRNGATAADAAPAAPASAQANGVQATSAPAETGPKITDKLPPQATKAEAPVQKESASAKPSTPEAAPAEASAKPKPPAAPAKNTTEKPSTPVAPAEKPQDETPAQPDTIDPLLEQLLAHAESAPADPLEALNLLASQGPNLTRGEAPLPAATLPTTTLPTAPLTEPATTSSSALNTLLGESKNTADFPKRAAEPASGSVAVGVEAITTAEVTRAEAPVRLEKKRSDTDELVASRPTEGYTEPRLIVPQWLKNIELNPNQEGDKTEDQTEEDDDDKQRFSVSLPFESEEDMRLHESVERWWQRWRQQS